MGWGDVAVERETVSRDLHGEVVGAIDTRTENRVCVCDYCGDRIDTTQPVLHEVIRLADMRKFRKLLGLTKDWRLDAARCQHCTIETIDPATDGVDELLLRIPLAENDRVLSVDMSATMPTIVDHSPPPEGYYPPILDRRLHEQFQDPGLYRWIRIEYLLEHGPESSDAVSSISTSQNVLT